MMLHEAPPTRPQYRPDIDGLRAIAILAVVFFHAFPARVKGGYIGVDIFFVISGYLISGIILRGLANDNFSLRSFYSHRIRRIFPALAVMLFTVFGFSWFYLLPEEFSHLGKHMLAGLAFVQNIALWQEAGYFDTTSDLKPLMHLWSLAVEEQFYLFFPLICMGAWRYRSGIFRIFMMLLFFSFALNVFFVHSNPEATFFLPHSRVWELLAGSVLAYGQLACRGELLQKQDRTQRILRRIASFGSRESLRNLLASIGFLLLLAGIFGLNKNKVFPGWWALAPVFGTLTLIAAGPGAWVNRHLLASRWMVFVGLISYPLYLWHWPLLSLARIVGEVSSDTSMTVILLLISFFLAWLTYRWVERPIRFGLPGLHKELVLVCTMFVLAGAGGYVYVNDGVSSRYPDADKRLTQKIDFKWYEYVRTGRCHLQDGDTLQHDASCYEQGHPSIALWGDSHASALYPGLHKLQAEYDFSVTQLTTSACPPIFGAETANAKARRNCGKVNELVLRSLVLNKPDLLIIHSVYQSDHQFIWPTDVVLKSTAATLQRVRRELPLTKVVLIGPMPRWRESPQKTSFLFWRKQLYAGNSVKGIGPIRQQANTMDELDEELSSLANNQDVAYISPKKILCDSNGCISRVGELPEQFIAVDYGHLSKAGSEFFINSIRQQLLSMLDGR